MRVLGAHLLDIYVRLNKEVSRGNRWAALDKVPVFASQDDLHCFRYYAQAVLFARRHSGIARKYQVLELKPLFRCVTGILLRRDALQYVDTDNYVVKTNYTLMNTKNLDYLKDNLKYLGFDTRLNDDLEKQVRAGKPEFSLHAQIPHYTGKMEYTLHVRKSDQSDMYFLNKMDASLKTGSSEKDHSQTFYISKGSGVTAKEAFNLLEGRAVQKDVIGREGEKVKAWMKLDFNEKDERGNQKVKMFYPAYGFDLEKTLSRFTIKELNDPKQKEDLLKSLGKGNVQMVTGYSEGKEVKRMIEASPQFKTINVYNEQQKPVKRESLLKTERKEDRRQGQDASQEQKSEKRRSKKQSA